MWKGRARKDRLGQSEKLSYNTFLTASTDPTKSFAIEMPFRATPCWDELARPLISYWKWVIS